MKKLALFVAFVLLLSLFTGCHSSGAAKQPAGEDEEILYCPAPMTKETYKRLFSTDSDDWDPSTFWSKDDPEGFYKPTRRYYGTYNGFDVMIQNVQIQSIDTYTIAGFEFIYNACNIIVSKDGGTGVTLEKAYEHGLLTKEDIETIYNYHRQTEKTLYAEYSTNK